MYEVIETEKFKYIRQTLEDGSAKFIPFDEENGDYKQYLEHLKKSK